MKLLLLFLAFTASIFAADNELTDAEKSGGWKLLFDGKDAAGHWRGYKKDSLPGKWVVKDGTLALTGKGGETSSRRSSSRVSS